MGWLLGGPSRRGVIASSTVASMVGTAEPARGSFREGRARRGSMLMLERDRLSRSARHRQRAHADWRGRLGPWGTDQLAKREPRCRCAGDDGQDGPDDRRVAGGLELVSNGPPQHPNMDRLHPYATSDVPRMSPNGIVRAWTVHPHPFLVAAEASSGTRSHHWAPKGSMLTNADQRWPGNRPRSGHHSTDRVDQDPVRASGGRIWPMRGPS